MTQRITRTWLEKRIELVNKYLGTDIFLNRRYNYYAIDANNGSRTLATGMSAQEADRFIDGMLAVIEMKR